MESLCEVSQDIPESRNLKLDRSGRLYQLIDRPIKSDCEELVTVTCKLQTLRSVLKNKMKINQTLKITLSFLPLSSFLPDDLAVLKRYDGSVFNQEPHKFWNLFH